MEKLPGGKSYNTSTKQYGPVPSGNGVWGEKISVDEARKLNPELVDEVSEYLEYFTFYKKGSTVNRIPEASKAPKKSSTSGTTSGQNENSHNGL